MNVCHPPHGISTCYSIPAELGIGVVIQGFKACRLSFNGWASMCDVSFAGVSSVVNESDHWSDNMNPEQTGEKFMIPLVWEVTVPKILPVVARKYLLCLYHSFAPQWLQPPPCIGLKIISNNGNSREGSKTPHSALYAQPKWVSSICIMVENKSNLFAHSVRSVRSITIHSTFHLNILLT